MFFGHEIVCSDPYVVQDLMTTKNRCTDFESLKAAYMRNLLGDAFILSKVNERWKAKRKASSHAFYKDRMSNMVSSLKNSIMCSFRKWIEQIEKSSDGYTEIDITREI